MNVDPLMFRTFARESVGILEPGLRTWAVQTLLMGLPLRARLAERDRALRAAAAFLPDSLNTAERVRRLREEMSALERSAMPSHPDMTTFRGCLALSMLARDKVLTERQIRNILE